MIWGLRRRPPPPRYEPAEPSILARLTSALRPEPKEPEPPRGKTLEDVLLEGLEDRPFVGPRPAGAPPHSNCGLVVMPCGCARCVKHGALYKSCGGHYRRAIP